MVWLPSDLQWQRVGSKSNYKALLKYMTDNPLQRVTILNENSHLL